MSPLHQTARAWLLRDPDPITRAELQALLDAGDDAALQRRFDGRLAFGTAGLRGVLGAGPTCMNRVVVRETTAGLADYLADTVPGAAELGVVVAFDGRRMSDVFADDATAVLVARGFRVVRFDGLTATPVCARAVVACGAAAGIMVTASHNPPEYNGYKVYWSNGAQIIPPHDGGIAAAIDAVAGHTIVLGPVDDPRVERIGGDFERRYLDEALALSPYGDDLDRSAVRIAYTPMHGVGAHLVEPILGDAGFANVWTVASQRDPDGAFPTVAFPNPEEDGAMDEVVALATAHDAHLAMANDPDADRLAVAVRRGPGEYLRLTGDQIGVLLGDERLRHAPRPAAVGTTIVSSRMLSRVAATAGASSFTTLTGFKWIANRAIELAAEGVTFAMGYEEAIGFTIGDLVRDKDGVSAVVTFAELTARLLAEGRTPLDRLEDLYREHGLFLTHQHSLKLDPHREGPTVGDQLRATPPTTIAGRAVVTTIDVHAGVERDADGTTRPVDLPKSDVLVFFLDDDSRVIVRPSGTEPKLKCYYEIVADMGDRGLDDAMAAARTTLMSLVDAHQSELDQLAGA